jgi:hypothetical protein
MQYYYYVYPAILLLVIIVFGRYVMQKRKSISARLFAEALKDENSGHFEEAVLTYRNALDEVKKTRFHSNMENKIVAKLKVLNTVIEYTNNSHFTR